MDDRSIILTIEVFLELLLPVAFRSTSFSGNFSNYYRFVQQIPMPLTFFHKAGIFSKSIESSTLCWTAAYSNY
jgi:hypothetical protein